MKNFSEAMAIKKDLKISVGLKIRPIEKTWCKITLNGLDVFTGVLKSTKLLIAQVGIDDPIHIKVEVEREHPQAIVIESLGINSFPILPRFQHACNPPTGYIDFNGTWEINVSPSFYPWYHEVSGNGWILN